MINVKRMTISLLLSMALFSAHNHLLASDASGDASASAANATFDSDESDSESDSLPAHRALLETMKANNTPSSSNTSAAFSQSLRHGRTPYDRPFQCIKCDKSFPQKSDLDRHERIHELDKPFKCIKCSQSFSQQAHLNMHKRNHLMHYSPSPMTTVDEVLDPRTITSGFEAPYRCSECNQGFFIKNSLDIHKRLHKKRAKTAELEQKVDDSK